MPDCETAEFNKHPFSVRSAISINRNSSERDCLEVVVHVKSVSELTDRINFQTNNC